MSVTYQTTNPTTNKPTGQPNQPVTIPAGKGQSFVLSLTASALAASYGESFLFQCDGVTPAPVFSGINTADFTFLFQPKDRRHHRLGGDAKRVRRGVRPSEPPAPGCLFPGGQATVAFPIAALNLGASELVQVSTDSGTVLSR